MAGGGLQLDLGGVARKAAFVRHPLFALGIRRGMHLFMAAGRLRLQLGAAANFAQVGHRYVHDDQNKLEPVQPDAP
ncbi:hypothetical protein D3C72_2425800 [compost metagenome]